jgi:cytochrome c peroxidase
MTRPARIGNKRQSQPRKAAEEAAARRNDVQCIGAHADYCRDDYVFPRQQSLEMRATEWGERLKPMKPWVPNFAANLAFSLFA